MTKSSSIVDPSGQLVITARWGMTMNKSSKVFSQRKLRNRRRIEYVPIKLRNLHGSASVVAYDYRCQDEENISSFSICFPLSNR